MLPIPVNMRFSVFLFRLRFLEPVLACLRKIKLVVMYATALLSGQSRQTSHEEE